MEDMQHLTNTKNGIPPSAKAEGILEKLENIRSKDSKIRGYSEKNQWAFAQFGSMLRYKCALRGIPLFEVDPAYTSQTCSRCQTKRQAVRLPNLWT
jgi:putative transposase